MASALGYSRSTLPSGATASGVLYASTTAAGTPASLVETDLATYTIEANKLAVGKIIQIYFNFLTGANANNKTMKVYFGATAVFTAGPAALNGQNVAGVITIAVTGTAAEVSWCFSAINSTFAGTNTLPAVDITAPIAVRWAGTNGTAVANDVTFRAGYILKLN
jgi:hypothetical protein